MGSENSKEAEIGRVERYISDLGFSIVEKNISKPWGAYFKIDEKYSGKFVDMYFPEIKWHLNNETHERLEHELPNRTPRVLSRGSSHNDPHERLEHLENTLLSPKFLLISPQARLSWQYHHRRSEAWKIIYGPVGSIISDNDQQTEPRYHRPGEFIRIKNKERHRLISGDGWGLVAEIWIHKDPTNLSDEEDNVRLADDFKREGTSDRGESVFY